MPKVSAVGGYCCMDARSGLCVKELSRVGRTPAARLPTRRNPVAPPDAAEEEAQGGPDDREYHQTECRGAGCVDQSGTEMACQMVHIIPWRVAEQKAPKLVCGEINGSKGKRIGDEGRSHGQRHIRAQRHSKERCQEELPHRDDESGEQPYGESPRDAAAIEVPQRRMAEQVGERPDPAAPQYGVTILHGVEDTCTTVC